MQADLILYAVVAAGLVFWLRSILGTRHGEERERPNPFTAAPSESAPAASDIGMAMPGMALPSMRSLLPRNVSLQSEEVEEKLMRLSAQDVDFDIVKFAQGAQDAFAIIVEAFAAGDRDTLQTLLEPAVFKAFDTALNDRAARGEAMSTEIHAVKKAEILDARTQSQTAYITVRFIAEETCVIRAGDGVILSGDPDRITEMNDIWTFSRPLKNRDPRWFLHETRDGDVAEDHKTPVPDMK